MLTGLGLTASLPEASRRDYFRVPKPFAIAALGTPGSWGWGGRKRGRGRWRDPGAEEENHRKYQVSARFDGPVGPSDSERMVESPSGDRIRTFTGQKGFGDGPRC